MNLVYVDQEKNISIVVGDYNCENMYIKKNISPNTTNCLLYFKKNFLILVKLFSLIDKLSFKLD